MLLLIYRFFQGLVFVPSSRIKYIIYGIVIAKQVFCCLIISRLFCMELIFFIFITLDINNAYCKDLRHFITLF